jgi:hypothetical protein
MSLITTQKYPSLAWFDPTGKGDVQMTDGGYEGFAGWPNQSLPFKALMTFLMTDCFEGDTYRQRLLSRKLDPYKRHLQHRYYLADAVFEKVDTDEVIRQKLWPLLEELPKEGGIVLFRNGGQYLYRVCDAQESRMFLDNPDLLDAPPPMGARWFMVALVVGDAFMGFECGVLHDGEARLLTDQSIHHPAVVDGTFTAFVATTLLFLRYAEVETKVTGPKDRRARVNEVKYVNQTGFDVQVVDSRWFTTLVRTGAFGVRGHFRLQPFGEGGKQRKLIWVGDYQKQGYVRRAKMAKYVDSQILLLPGA